jgi:hypothetical protein
LNSQSTVASDDFQYDPDNLLNVASLHLHAKNDAALARALNVMPPVISKIHEKTRISIVTLRELMGDRRPYFNPPV